MSKPGKQFSLVGGVQSGAGSLHAGTAAVDQTGNLLNLFATVHTPNVDVGNEVSNFKGRRKHFGSTGTAKGMFDYPDLAVKNPQGNGQSYKASKADYLPGNNNAGQAGFGTEREFDRSTMVSEDLVQAYNIAHRSADLIADSFMPEHKRTLNRDYETLREHFEEQKKEHELQKASKLLAMGFSEEEIARKAAKEREVAIEQAAKMDTEPHHSLEKALMRMEPTTDIGLSVAPGLMPNRINADAFQRAVGAGTVVTKGKAAEAMRRREAMALKIDAQKPEVKLPLPHEHIVTLMRNVAAQEEHKRQEQSMIHEDKIQHHKVMSEKARMARHFAMEKAMEKR